MISFIEYILKNNEKYFFLNTHIDNTLGSGNPSIIKYGGTYYMTFRSCEYSFICYPKNSGLTLSQYDMSWYPCKKFNEVPTNFFSSNHIAKYDGHNIKILKKLELCSETRNNFCNGAEDLRLFENDKGELMVSYSKYEGSNVSMNIAKLDSDMNTLQVAKYIDNDKCEKNWMPVLDKTNRFIRKPFENIIKLETGTETVFKNYGNKNANFDKSGSTQAIPYKDKYICLVHAKTDADNLGFHTLQYYHKFILLDKDLKPEKESDWFVFFGYPIEFTCGMHIEDDKVLLPISVWDSVSAMIELSTENLLKFINKDYDSNEIEMNKNYLKNISMDLLRDFPKNYGSKIAIESFLGTTAETKEDAMKWYVNVLCDIKEFKIGMHNTYMHMLLGEDSIVDILKTINTKK